ncbi:MAG: 1-phosphofructokinase family hexose kinase [Candidatus Brocadiia bacterium]
MIVTVTLNPAVDKALDVPGFEVGAHARARVQSVLPAGKGNNVARGVARLGGKALATGLVGRAEVAAFDHSLSADGVRTWFQPVDGTTRTNTTILDPEARTTTHLREEGFTVSPADLEGLRRILLDCMWESCGAAVVFAGSLPPGCGPADLAGLIASVAEAGGRLVVDTSGPALRAAVDGGHVATIKPNLTELRQLLDEEVSPEQAPGRARELLDRVGTVLLTLGAGGAYVVREDVEVGLRCPLPEAELGNTVGCGDAFLAGWLRGLELTETPEETLRWAVAAGAASAMSETTVGYTLEDVRRLLPRCEPANI